MQALTTSNPQLVALHAIYKDPELFVRQWLRAVPEPWQITFMKMVSESDRVAVKSGHGVGKSAVLAWIILWMVLTRYPVKIAVTAPSAGQLDGALWPEIMAWHGKLPPEIAEQVTITADKVYLTEAPGDSFALARTASKDKSEAIQGFHSINSVFVIDEASGVDEKVFDVAMGSLSTTKSKMILTGNPTRVTGTFYECFTPKMAHLWKTMTVSCFDSKYSRDGDLIKLVAARSGVDSDEYRVRVLGEFPRQDQDMLIPRDLIEAAQIRNIDQIDAPTIWGLDVARQGGDRSALCKRKGNVVTAPVKTWTKKDLMQTAMIVADEFNMTAEKDRPDEIYIDIGIMGAGVADRLKELGLPARGVNMAEAAASKDRYNRLRDELWGKALEWFTARDCKLPEDDPTLVNELCAPRYKYLDSGKVKVEGKDEMRKRGLRSCDVADAFILTMMNNQTDNHRRKAFMRPFEQNDKWIV